MGETFEVSLEVKGPRERILTELRSLPSIGEVKEVDAPEAGAALPATFPLELRNLWNPLQTKPPMFPQLLFHPHQPSPSNSSSPPQIAQKTSAKRYSSVSQAQDCRF